MNTDLFLGETKLKKFFLILLLAIFASSSLLSLYAGEFSDADFIEPNSQPATFNQLNDTAWQNFYVSSGTVNFVFRFVSEYLASAAVIDQSNLSAFQSGASVPSYATFSNQFGTKFVTLGPGNYSVVFRNNTSGTNNYNWHFDYVENLPGGSFHDWYLWSQGTVGKNGGKFWQPFTIQNGFRYYFDGISTGVKFYVLDASNFALWQSGSQFYYYSDYSSDYANADAPEETEFKLPAGDYYLAWQNDGTVDEALCYTCSRWTDPTYITPTNWRQNNSFGWIYNYWNGWFASAPLGQLWFKGNWAWSTYLNGWLYGDGVSTSLWSTQFRWLTLYGNGGSAYSSALGWITIGNYNGWVYHAWYGWVWANGDGTWYYSNWYGWLGVTPSGGVWCVNQGRFL